MNKKMPPIKVLVFDPAELEEAALDCGCAFKSINGRVRFTYCATHYAAPDLLAALEGLLDWALSNRGTAHEFVTCRSDGELDHPALNQARAAIAQAKGESSS